MHQGTPVPQTIYPRLPTQLSWQLGICSYRATWRGFAPALSKGCRNSLTVVQAVAVGDRHCAALPAVL